ncbi:MAG: hypothetical protein COT74_09640 [Bdellovibrionales bacterium CG10_big_fil_rev_8_21_14_0_10_45_34]|nr:MAG: hypothetical protein COT74_09640 [Bdellovibrionales bacterium CG10_big_fil_rev_8_21_14_0_10_45_34]
MNWQQLLISYFFLVTLSPAVWAEECTTLVENEVARVYQCDRLKIVKIAGSPSTRASQFGALLQKGIVSSVPLTFFSEAQTRGLSRLNPLKRWLLTGYLTFWKHFRLSEDPDGLTDEMKILSGASGLGWDRFNSAIKAPDVGAFAAGNNPQHQTEELGCTSISKLGDDGSFTFARNFDYDGIGVWDKSPSLFVSVPEEGSADLKALSIGTDGVNFSSISGINERGIGLVVHQAYAKVAEGKGIPLYLIGEGLLRKSGTLEEAIEYLRHHRPLPIWYFVLFDINSKKSVVVEAGSQHFDVIESNTDFAKSNHMGELGRSQWETARQSTLYNSNLRRDYALNSLAELNSLSPEGAAAILSHRASKGTGVEIQDDLMKGDTLQTLIVHVPSSGGNAELYVSAGEAPAASSNYLKFSLEGLFELQSSSTFDKVDLVKRSPYERDFEVQLSKAIEEWQRDPDSLLSAPNYWGGTSIGRAVGAYVYSKMGPRAYLDWLSAKEVLGLADSNDGSLIFMKVISLYRSRMRSEFEELAHKYLANEDSNKEYKEIVQNLLNNSEELLPEEIGFSFSSGDLRY